MSVCVKIVIKIEIGKKNQKIVIYLFCPYRTALDRSHKLTHIRPEIHEILLTLPPMQSMRDLDNLISDMRTVETLGDGNSASE